MADGNPAQTYEIGFDGGHRFQLLDRPGVFKVSQAGLALGNHLVANVTEGELNGRILDVGTGSGAIALLLRSLGATSVAATDVHHGVVTTAQENELENYGDSSIEFSQCDMFPVSSVPDDKLFDLIVFNPPGWRSPPEMLLQRANERRHMLDLDAMFYGDKVLLRFLDLLPEHLAANGRAIVGLNSLIGIADIIRRARANRRAGHSAFVRQLLERFEFPLLFYTDQWRDAEAPLVDGFARGRREYAATYETKGDTIHWFYEITEITLERAQAPACGFSPDPATQPQTLAG